ncbi:Kap123 protein [Starmerella bacillaris]|uniref:Kap123 protein n=1 Tax=Starmerella bacillaris TaxID=1247836 RepID=A0AAV5RP44_STABA|nr:Kap123 protein [Starmerella bacillaris]
MDSYVTELVGTLERVLNARDSQSVKSATNELHKKWYKVPDTVPALIEILQVHPSPQIRQLSGVEVRKLIPKFWYERDNALDEDKIEAIKASLLSKSLGEENDLVRHTVARVISAIASIDLDLNRWPQLLPELFRAAREGDVRMREVATYVLYALLDSSDYCAAAAQSPEEVLPILAVTLNDPESLQVRVNSVLALSGLSTALTGAEAEQFQQLIPGVVNVLGQCVAANDDKSATQIFESLSELIDADASLLGPAFGELLAHMITNYGSNAEIDPEFRVSAMRVVATAVVYRYKRIQRMKMAPELTKMLVELIASECTRERAEGTENNDDDEDDEDDVTVLTLCLQALENLAARLPPSHVIAPLLQLLPSLVHTSDPALQRAGYLAFSVSCEGAPDFVASESATLLPWIVEGLQNNDISVRYAALQALCQFGEASGDELGKKHQTLVPLVYGILDAAPSLKVCESACTALAAIMRNLSNEIVTNEYLPGLMPRLLAVVRDADNLDLKGFVVTIIGTTAEVAGRNFLPYFQDTVNVLNHFVSAVTTNGFNAEELPLPSAKLISESLGALSRIACAVGPEAFAPFLDGWMAAVMVCLGSENSQLRELVPLYICEMADVYKGDFGGYVSHIVPHLINVIEMEEIYTDEAFQQAMLEGSAANGELQMDEIDDFGDGIKVNSDLCLEKEFVLDCLGTLWQKMPEAMTPFHDVSLEGFRSNSEHFYEDIRQSSIIGLWRMYQSLPNDENVRQICWEVTKDFLDAENDMGVVDTVFELITAAAKQMGAAAFPSEVVVQSVLTTVYEVIKKTHRVFEEFDGENDADGDAAGDEDSEAATQLVQTSLDLLVEIANVMGEQFVPLFEQFADALRPYAASAVDQERENGVAAFAELVGAMKAGITPWTEGLLQAFVAALDDKSEGVKSIAAYGVGFLATFSNDEKSVVSAYPVLFEKITLFLQNSESASPRAIANAAGGYARLALRYPQAVPVQPMECLATLSKALPLTDAYEEYPPILQFLAAADLPESAKQLVTTLWEQHLDAEKRNSVKSVSYSPADDPLGDAEALEAWKICAQKLGVTI